ncbi:hypothetical protein Moror_5044 [Moniliophthora roreri MCA 2997]|uniref:Uncharacterized protein n=1 Tax=Moniliophthora roreri (strain MCA 2997) TaxID=1381753 RepID=V2WXP3_MONRO|nr:hypothetical protein Moror_5044 [Moniliophthora roreri MCA 2997]
MKLPCCPKRKLYHVTPFFPTTIIPHLRPVPHPPKYIPRGICLESRFKLVGEQLLTWSLVRYGEHMPVVSCILTRKSTASITSREGGNDKANDNDLTSGPDYKLMYIRPVIPAQIYPTKYPMVSPIPSHYQRDTVRPTGPDLDIWMTKEVIS